MTAPDVGALKALWRAVFCDPEEEIDRFFSHFYAPERTVAITEGGELAAMAHLLPAGSLVLGGKAPPCAMLYAVASAPHLRGRGFGRRVTEEAVQRAQALGFEAVVLHPAEKTLFSFYEKLGFLTAFSACFTGIINLDPQSEPETHGAALRRISSAEYAALRRRYLDGRVFIDFTPHAFAYQEALCGEGGLFAVERGGETVGCAIVERGGEETAAKELLCSPRDFDDAVAALERAFPAHALSVRAPEWAVPGGSERAVPFGMLYLTAAGYPQDAAGWYGPAFD
ncbi:MAG: GNAT family N-acetyltransferase [Clostridiales bacterium]|nr:GNAT family N-acetyltransferase [Clostridiales bacterium]